MIDGREFLLTDAFNGVPNKTVLWYTQVNGKLEPRYFYYSNSGANWHCAPGVDADCRISKSEKWNKWGYEKGTVVSDALQKALWRLPIQNIEKDFTMIWKQKIGYITRRWEPESELTRSSQFDDFRNRDIIDISKENLKPSINLSALKNMQIDSRLDLSFRWGFKKWPDIASHAYFWDLEAYTGTTLYNGESIEVVFVYAKNSPDLVLIENIRLPNAQMDSFNLPKIMFNGVMLTAKPAVYDYQIPFTMRKNKIHFDGHEYYDIRSFLQDNPLITTFKRLRW